MKNCDEFQSWFADYLSQALPAPQGHELEDHLVLCPNCRQDLEAERHLDQLLATQPLAPPPPDFTLQVLARIQRERAPAPGLGRWLLRGLPYAASALALLVGLNRVFGALPASLWGKSQTAVLQGFAALASLGKETNALPLLPQINPVAILSVLALLTLALYLSLAEEH
ncbi:MAG: zf-HC2 domain-containing protein [Candidatus Latescibacteria bacterium]|nr:zf-HC2 domain-containing protein [Candidatus Latescibacterota bacterium]